MNTTTEIAFFLSGCYLELPGMVNSGCAVNMTVSSLGIKLTSIESGRVISTHDMQGISFASGGEKVSWYFKCLKPLEKNLVKEPPIGHTVRIWL